jgi:hypothetical protein
LVGRFRNVPLLFPLTADCNREPSSLANVRFFAFSFVNGYSKEKKELFQDKKLSLKLTVTKFSGKRLKEKILFDILN